MFTGIIQDVGRIVEIINEPEQAHMHFTTTLDMQRWQLGDSIAVNGCCLTITNFPEANTFAATLSSETLALTCFSDASVGDAVNLEPALCVGDALGGHWVTGHIDDRAEVMSIMSVGEHVQMTFKVPQALAPYIVRKGSVALHGVSLTINTVHGCTFSVNLIPHTLAHTNLGALQDGEQVNIETDLIGRYVERMMQYRSLDETGNV